MYRKLLAFITYGSAARFERRGSSGGLFLLKGMRIAGFPFGAAHVGETPK
jgi:hypothetical protein